MRLHKFHLLYLQIQVIFIKLFYNMKYVFVGGSLSAQLKAVDVPILPDAKCKDAYQDAFQDTMLCAGYEDGGKDSCQVEHLNAFQVMLLAQ